MSDKNAEDYFGFASEQAPHPQALAGARHAASRFRGRWRRQEPEIDERQSAFAPIEEVHGDDPSIWVRAGEPTPLPVHRTRPDEEQGFLARAARAAFPRLTGS